MAWIETSKKNPCPICGKAGWCSVTDDGAVAFCHRVNTGQGKHKICEDGNEGWIYRLNGAPLEINPPPEQPKVARAADEVLDKVYTDLLKKLELSAEHRENLLWRGLTEEAINANRYRTLPLRGRSRLAKALIGIYGQDLIASVPGFYLNNDNEKPYWTLAGAPGILIPVRDLQGRITGLKIRRCEPDADPKYIWLTSKSHGGPGPANSVHVPKFSGDTSTVRVTEGELKADIATALSGVLTVSIPGVSCWRQAAPALKELGAKTVLIAFDADASTNPFVARALRNTVEDLINEGFQVSVETWDIKDGKGIDDLLAAGKKPELVAGEDFLRETPPERTLLEQAILYLAGQCDGAKTKDSAGFNKRDAETGRVLAEKILAGEKLSLETQRIAIKMLKKYGQQLLAAGIDPGEIKPEEPPKKAAAEAEGKPAGGGNLPEIYSEYIAALEKTGRYFIQPPGHLCYLKFYPGGDSELIPVANFVARPVREVTRDNGADREIEFEIAGVLAGGHKLPPARVAAKDFASLSWVPAAWGLGANVEPGQGAKDRVRHSIQCLAQDTERETIYTHLGWRKIGGEWLYLHAAGAIGANGPVSGVAVDPGQGLQDYVLPDPPQGEDLTAAVRASLGLLHVAPAEITYPLLAAVYRAPVAEALPMDLSLFLAGQTGAKKSELTALVQAHWGAGFHGKNLPGNWDSTANALEKLAFLAKDAVLTVDDFAPKGTASDVQRLHREADRLLRAQGNLAGRDRMQADGKLRPRYAPRGLIISSGEDIPRGQSLRARGLILEVGPADVDLARLTEAQRAARHGLLAAAMAGYIRWLAAQMDNLKMVMRERHEDLRAEARKARFTHDRTPDIVANLALGWRLFLIFATGVGAVGQEEAAELWAGCWKALLAAGEAQAGYLASEEPTARFLALLAAAITSGKAHVADAKTGREPDDPTAWGWREQARGGGQYAETEYLPLGDQIGWLDGDDLLLDPEIAYAAAQKLARDQNSSLPITQRVLWKRMAERGLIFVERDEGRAYYTIKRTVGRQRRRVLILPKNFASLISHNVGNVGNVGDPLGDKGLRAQNAPTFLKTPQKCGQEMWAVNGGDNSNSVECPQKTPTLFEQNQKCGQENGPESLAGQGPAHNAHKAHKIGDKTAATFKEESMEVDPDDMPF